ncbi:ras-responsive element-binding protein 1 isoform 4 [Mus musculus]|uniref:ras-responsive element-binding protein 1 isoform 4 n=1 Tax=Mus musculus TaxID=10090 RepID=UPI0011AE7178|nr:ras-responsive element-binding protein 1 isoform 4 [Mus musculus]NP_001391689.1 ras-responsive element-binding protein 1 isoform 4 [Mus musculus]
MTSNSPIGLEGSDLSSINTMMSAVMSVASVTENGGSPQGIKSPMKPPGPNRIGRRNQETKEEKSSYNCPLCEKICTTQHQLTMHIRQHNTDTGGADHACSICGKSLSSASSLDRHMLVHSGERPYKCTVCGQSFTTNGNMHRHMKIHEKDTNSTTAAAPPSPLKRRRLSSKRKLSHDAESEDPGPAKKMVEDGQSGDLDKMSDEIFHCPVCFKEFVCKYELETHMETHSDNPLRCDICCVTFRTHRGLLRHNALVHKQLPRDAMGRPFIQNNPSIPAGFHDLGFTDFSCRKFPRISQAWCETNLRRCISEQHRFVCDTCDKAFPMLSSLILHRQSHIPADQGREKLQTKTLAAESLEQKAFLALLGLQHTKDVKPAPAEELLPDDNQAIQLQTLKYQLPQEPGCPTVLSVSPLDAASLGGSLTVLPATKENMKHLSLQPFQKGFIIQPDSSIVVKPISGESAIELADIQQILKMAASAPPQISLPPLSKAPATPLQAIFKHMPPLKPKPLVTPRTVVAASTPPPLINAQQASPGCISPSLPPQSLKFLKGSVEAVSNVHLLQSKSGIQPSTTTQLFLQQAGVELPGQPEMKTQLEQESIIEALLPLNMEAKIKQEITEGDLKAIMTGPSGKKTPAMRKVLYPCRFCNQVFAFSGVLRAHVRSHLGISPYQCNICDYIAADKAALIRHIRTHSGERPYICKICHYPFTVKANCERHLRKKHLKATRKDIEKNIEYVSSPTAELVDAFCAPETVCRLCGEDLKHYRALRIHMRTHCSRGLGGCHKGRKPFECKECNAPFVAKRNCIHHILKQHLHVPEKDIESYVLATNSGLGPADTPTDAASRGEEGSCVTFAECKPLATFLEPQNGFLHSSPTQPLPSHISVKLEPASSFAMDFNEPLDFSQKGLALVQVKQENVSSLLTSSSSSALYDCSMEPIDLSIPKSVKKGDKDTVVPSDAKKPEPEAGQAEPLSPRPPPCPTLSVTVEPKGSLETPTGTVVAVTTAAKLEPHTQPLQGSVQLAVPIYSPALVSNTPLLGNSAALLNNPALLRPLRPKPPLLLPKPSMTEELPPLASIAQIISSVSSAPTLLKTKVADPGPSITSSNTVATDSPGSSIPKAAATPTDTTSSKESSEPPPAASSPEEALPTEQGPAATSSSRKRGRKRGLRNRPLPNSSAVDLDSSGEFASIEKMLATTDTNKFSPFLQTAEDDTQEEVAGAPADQHGPADEEQGSPAEDRLLRAKRNSYANCLQKINCPHCPRVFPWASSLQRHMLTHTDSQSDTDTLTTPGEVLDLTAQAKEQPPAEGASEISPASQDLAIKEAKAAAAPSEEEEEKETEENPEPEEECRVEESTGAADAPEEDTASNQSLDLDFATKLMDFKLAESEAGSVDSQGPAQQEPKHACDTCGKNFKFLGTLSRHKKAHSCQEPKEEEAAAPSLENEGVGRAVEGPSPSPEPEEKPAESLAIDPTPGTREASVAKQNEETEGPTDGEGERPYKCQTCERTFTLKHSLVRHQRIHQKARHSKHHGKDSDKDERAEEDSEDESTHSATNPASENEAESAPSTSNHVAVTRSRKESLSTSGKECSPEERAAAEQAAEPSAPKEQASPGETDPQSPAAIVQDLLELCGKRPAPILAATDGASQLLGME